MMFNHQFLNLNQVKMRDITPGDLVWIPANTSIKYPLDTLLVSARTRVPTYGLVIGLDGSPFDGDAIILRNDEKLSVRLKDIRKIDSTEETNGSVSRSY